MSKFFKAITIGFFASLMAMTQVLAVPVYAPGSQTVERADIYQLRDDKTFQVLEPTTGVYADALYIETDDNNANYFRLYPSASGEMVELNVDGSDASVDLKFTMKGDGLADFMGTPGKDTLGLVTDVTADAGNQQVDSPRFYMIGSAYPTGGPDEDIQYSMQVQVLDADVGANQFVIFNNNSTPVFIVDNNGGVILQANATFSAESPATGPKPVLQLEAVDDGESIIKIVGASSSTDPGIFSDGPASDVPLLLGTKGAGIVYSNNPIHTKHSDGFVAGNGLDENFTLLTMDRASGDETLQWDESNQEFTFSRPVLVPELISTGLVETEDDVYITTSTRGIVLTSPDGSCARGTIDNSDNLTFSPISCP